MASGSAPPGGTAQPMMQPPLFPPPNIAAQMTLPSSMHGVMPPPAGYASLQMHVLCILETLLTLVAQWPLARVNAEQQTPTVLKACMCTLVPLQTPIDFLTCHCLNVVKVIQAMACLPSA